MQSNQRGTNKTNKKRKKIVLELKDKNQDKRNKTKKFTYLYFIFVLLILGLFNVYLYTKEEIKTLQYSEFKELITKGKISGLGIDKETIEGELSLEDGKKIKFLTIRVEDPELINDLQKSNIKYTGRTENRVIATIISWVLPLVFMILIWNLFMRKMGGSGPSSILNFGKNRGKIYGEDEIKITFEDAAGVDEAKEELKEIIEYLQYPQKFIDIGGKIPKGILLVGPPGTGKTLLAKAVAGEAKVPFFSMSGSDFVEMFVGVGASRVRDLFSQAQEKAPCIIFIDELDAVGKARGICPISSNDEREQTLNQLLAEMDGFGTKTGVIIMGATNRPEILDPALLRPGRFDRHVLVDRDRTLKGEKRS